MSICWIKIPAN